MHYIGVDGCKGGWLMLRFEQNGEWTWDLFTDITSLWAAHGMPRRLLIDIPIGLPINDRRKCDTAAREKLTRLRSSSVFPIPTREAMQASSYLRGCSINQAILGVKISKQTWNIRNKILEVDSWLQSHPTNQEIVLECHPEVAFWAWNGKQPMRYGKKVIEGQQERSNLMRQLMIHGENIYAAAIRHFPRKYVLPDDILDTMVLAHTARNSDLLTLPEQPELDAVGLPMQIVYPKL